MFYLYRERDYWRISNGKLGKPNGSYKSLLAALVMLVLYGVAFEVLEPNISSGRANGIDGVTL